MKFIDNHPVLKDFLKQKVLPGYLWVKSLKYLGDAKYCPCCRTGFSRFMEVGPKREPILCPRCRSTGRDRMFWFFWEKHQELLQPGMSILHIAPEDVLYRRFKNIPGVNYVAGDKFLPQFANTYPKGTIYVDLTDMGQFADNSFDFIYCSHVLEYIKDDRKALSELFRVMKPGKSGIISVPINYGHLVTLEDETITDPLEQERLYGDKGHLRYYGTDYMDKVKEAGFQTEFVPITDFISIEMIEKSALEPRDVIHLCRKP